MNMKEITSDAVDFLLHDLDCEVEEIEEGDKMLLTFVDDVKAYKTVDEVTDLLLQHGYNGGILIDPYSVTIGNELVY